MTDLLLNTRFGPYHIRDRIGAGGMSVVYKARDTQNNKLVALKVMRATMTEQSCFGQHFAQEVEIAHRLNHPHIIPVYDHAIIQQRPYFTMPYIRGGNLADLFHKPVHMSLRRAVCLLEQVGSALDYAHSQGVIHCDLKLENILLLGEDQVALGDFGVARVMDATSSIKSGELVGSPLYISPEQIMGEKVDHRADLYALAVIAYLLTTGLMPFASEDSMTTLYLHLSAMPPLPGKVNSKLTPGISAVLLRGLAKRPQARFGSARAFVTAFEQAAAARIDQAVTIKPHFSNPHTQQFPEDKLPVQTTLHRSPTARFRRWAARLRP